MPVYNYQARTKKGDVQVGRVEAPDKRVAADILQRHNLILIALEEYKDIPIYARRIKFFEKVKAKDIVIFSRQLATLLEAEVPMVTSLQTVGSQAESALFREKIYEIASDVGGGSSLSVALSKHPAVFSDFYVNMIRAGEASGKMDDIMIYLADHTEREYEVISKVRGAMIYPSFVIAGFFIAVVVMMIFVIPQLTSVFEQSSQKLPVLTKLIIFSSDFFRSYWYVLLIALVGGGAGFWRYIKTPSGKKFWDRAQIKLPIIGQILIKVYLFRFTESLSTLIEGGIPITRALTISADITGNSVYKAIIQEAREDVSRGGTIGGALVIHKEIPPLVTQMVVVGEQAGKLVAVLRNVARFYQKEVDMALENITSLIEPVLIVFMGIGVGILVAGVMLPIYNMVGSF